MALSAVTVGLVVAGALARPAGQALQTYTSPLMLEFIAGVWLAEVWTRGAFPGGARGRRSAPGRRPSASAFLRCSSWVPTDPNGLLRPLY